MKLKFKINKGDRQVGNFVYHLEKYAVKVSDINGIVSHRISTLTPKGQFVAMAVEQKDKEDWLMAYAVTVFNMLCVVPDETFMSELNKSAKDCLERHRDLYGLKKDIDRAEDDKILENEKEIHEAVESLKEGAE